MRPISSAAQMRALDAAVIEGLGLPGVALMELASRGVADVVAQRVGPGEKVEFKIGFGVVNAGQATLSVEDTLQYYGSTVYHLRTRART